MGSCNSKCSFFTFLTIWQSLNQQRPLSPHSLVPPFLLSEWHASTKWTSGYVNECVSFLLHKGPFDILISLNFFTSWEIVPQRVDHSFLHVPFLICSPFSNAVFSIYSRSHLSPYPPFRFQTKWVLLFVFISFVSCRRSLIWEKNPVDWKLHLKLKKLIIISP